MPTSAMHHAQREAHAFVMRHDCKGFAGVTRAGKVGRRHGRGQRPERRQDALSRLRMCGDRGRRQRCRQAQQHFRRKSESKSESDWTSQNGNICDLAKSRRGWRGTRHATDLASTPERGLPRVPTSSTTPHRHHLVPLSPVLRRASVLRVDAPESYMIQSIEGGRVRGVSWAASGVIGR